MIVDHANKVLIGTPAKTGCTSLEFSIRYRDDVPDGLEVVHWPKEMGGGKKPHGLLIPPGCEDYTRYLTVRHPLDRLVSLYQHLNRDPFQWNNQAEEISTLHDFESFARWWIRKRHLFGFDGSVFGMMPGAYNLSWWLPGNIWLINLRECYLWFRPQGFIKLESYVEDLTKINPYWGTVPHRMKAPAGVSTRWQDNYSEELRKFVLDNGARSEMEVLGYPYLKPTPTKKARK